MIPGIGRVARFTMQEASHLTQPPDIVEPEKREGKKENKKEEVRKTNETASRCFTKGFQMGRKKDGDESVGRKRRGEEGGSETEGTESESKRRGEREEEEKKKKRRKH